MRFAILVLVLMVLIARADRGPWHRKAAAHAALWTRFVVSDPKRAVEQTRGPLHADVVVTATCMSKQPRLVKGGERKLSFVTCLGEQLAAAKIDPLWIVAPAAKLPAKAHQKFAKQFDAATTKFVFATHARGFIVLAFGTPARKRDAPPVLGVLVDEANAK